jgi:hypothetical protein
MAVVSNKVRLEKAFIGLRPSKYVMELKRVQFFMIPDLWRIVVWFRLEYPEIAKPVVRNIYRTRAIQGRIKLPNVKTLIGTKLASFTSRTSKNPIEKGKPQH